MRSTLTLLLLAGLMSACTVLPPLPPGAHFEQRQRPIYVPIVQERAELRRIYQLVREHTGHIVEVYEDQHGRRHVVEDFAEPRRGSRHGR